jgi:hypothetical protein
VHSQLVNSLFHVVVLQQVYSLGTDVFRARINGLYIDLAVDGLLGVYLRDELGVWNLCRISSALENGQELTRLSSFGQFTNCSLGLLTLFIQFNLLRISSCLECEERSLPSP